MLDTLVLNFDGDVIADLLLEGLGRGDDTIVPVDVEEPGVFAGQREPKLGILALVSVGNFWERRK